ncbi:nematocyst expressed protein 3-like isoform X1 [Gallus gallus]|uniref:nematocyst expressed protein 3-like isoform X1 n=1 Tax=Gallus gallus TaxID=9031 RepID=UPI001F021B76|nr:nematocyst expressed protein 3-like isoform X1 [Gallus gallus]XP_046795175.1 nematocyst expressed protein 3-like isoform X1 [Gallus gallus]
MAGSGASAGRAGSTAGASAAPPPRVRACACASSVGPARVRAPARAPSPPAGGGAPRSAPVCARVSVRVPGTQHVPARRAWEVLLASVPSAAPRPPPVAASRAVGLVPRCRLTDTALRG